jgi:hypothetical protein
MKSLVIRYSNSQAKKNALKKSRQREFKVLV